MAAVTSTTKNVGTQATGPGVLDGVRVLDFGRYIAGPFCAALLADLGADVIRVEKVRGSEDRFLVPLNDAGDGALFMQVNRNKRGLTLNPMKPDGRAVVQRLVATADVVVANLPDAALTAMGLDYASLAAVKPDVILTSVSAFGAGGPYSEKTGFDGIGQAMSGAMYLSERTGAANQELRALGRLYDRVERDGGHSGGVDGETPTPGVARRSRDPCSPLPSRWPTRP